MQKVRTARGRVKRTAAAVDKAAVTPRDRVATVYAPIAVKRHPISGACPVMDSNAPSAERQWLGSNSRLFERRDNTGMDLLKSR